MKPLLATYFLSFVTPALAATQCPSVGATIEDCPAMFYPVPKTPATHDPGLVPLLAGAQSALQGERAAVEAWLDARKKQHQAKAEFDSSWIDITGDVSRKFHETTLKYREAAAVLARRKYATDVALEALVDAAGQSYGAKPARTDFSSEPIAKRLAKWSPIPNRCETTDEETGKCRLRTPDEQEKHVRSGANSVYATTHPITGQIVINSEAFDRPDPEEFPATLLHESVHWVDITSIGGFRSLPNNSVDIRPAEKFDRERTAYLEEAKFFRKLKLEAKAQVADAAAEEFRVQSEITRTRNLSWTDIRTRTQYRAWRGVQDHFQADVRQELDYDAETLQEIHQGTEALDERLRQDADHRLQDARRDPEALATRVETHRWMFAEAAQCGFEPLDSWNLQYRVAGRFPVENIHFEWNSRETFKASLLLAAACHTPEKESPCNDAMDVITSLWDDEAFRKTIELFQDSHEDTRFCVAHIARRLGRPKGFGKIQKEAKSYRKWLVERARQPSPEPGPETDSTRPTPRPPREDPTPPPPTRPRCRFMGDWCD